MHSLIQRPWVKRSGWVVLIIALAYGGYAWFGPDADTAATASAMVLEEVSTGSVTSGIRTSGTIEAAEILDLNVYKQNARITSLAVTDGTQVTKGQLLFAFDESDVAVSIAESSLAVREAELGLEKEREASRDPNITIASLTNDIVVLERNLVEYEQDLKDALRDFHNTDLEAEPTPARFDEQVTRTAPTIGGLYNAPQEGSYILRVYASGADSGYSYQLSGLESGTYEVFEGASVPLGTRGLTITFPTGSAQTRDEWVVAVPNTYASEYTETKQDYEDTVASIKESIRTDTVTLANKRTQLAQAQRGDTSDDRSLQVESASLAIQKARVDLQAGVDTRDERIIKAPFSGTVEGMANVVVGATPSKDTSDTTDFGTLISDEFLVTFALSAVDVDKVSLGDKVLVTLTTIPGSAPLEAEITEISSLPTSSTVAQYEVSAKMVETASSSVRLRDGMLADIEIVQEEREGVVRVPVAALSFFEGKAQVTVVEGLSAEQEQQFARLGIVRTEGSAHTSYTRTVTLGLRGTYYVEVLEGLSTGERVLLGINAAAAQAEGTQTVRTGFGSGMGGGRPPVEHTE